MARCTAPVEGHRSASAAANCPACRGRTSRDNSYSYSPPPYLYSVPSYGNGSNNSSSSGGSVKSAGSGRRKASWASPSSSVLYTETELRTLTPVRDNVEKRSAVTDLRDIFLCHAWDDRQGCAKELHDLLESKKVSVWFSEKDVLLGKGLLREIDKGLVKSRVGIVLVTPAFLKRVQQEGIAEKELSALLARDLLVPIVHDTTFEALREVSPLLGSRSGLSTVEDSLANIAAKLAELITV
jgi:hypothetical protein